MADLNDALAFLDTMQVSDPLRDSAKTLLRYVQGLIDQPLPIIFLGGEGMVHFSWSIRQMVVTCDFSLEQREWFTRDRITDTYSGLEEENQGIILPTEMMDALQTLGRLYQDNP